MVEPDAIHDDFDDDEQDPIEGYCMSCKMMIEMGFMLVSTWGATDSSRQGA